MRNKLSLKKLTICITLVAVTLATGLYGTTNRSKTDGGNGAISLEAPFFISSAEATETGITAFPADKAGISAYVKVKKAIDLDKVRTIFTKVVDVGDNYIIGIVPIPNLGGDTEVHLYADTDGWLVAYLTQEEHAAKIMKWPANYDLSPITKITTTTLREALNNAGKAAFVRISAEIKYYDFKFPDANEMTLFVKAARMVSQDRAAAITQVKVPTDYTLYEASYYHYGYGGAVSGGRGVVAVPVLLKVDGAEISDLKEGYGTGGGVTKFGSYQGAIAAGVLHMIEINYPNPTFTAPDVACGNTVATVLIYKTN